MPRVRTMAGASIACTVGGRVSVPGPGVARRLGTSGKLGVLRVPWLYRRGLVVLVLPVPVMVLVAVMVAVSSMGVAHERRVRDDQWIALMRHPAGVRTSTINSAPDERTSRPSTVRVTALVDATQETSPRRLTDRTWRSTLADWAN